MPPTTLSARFDEKELDLLKKAADVKQWSLAQLIRVAAYEKAANILNATGAGVISVRRILGRVATQLRDPSYEVRDEEGRALAPNDDWYAECFDRWSLEIDVSRLDAADFMSLVRAIRSLGAEIVPLLEDEYLRAGTEEAKLSELIDPASLIAEPFEVSADLPQTESQPQHKPKSEQAPVARPTSNRGDKSNIKE